MVNRNTFVPLRKRVGELSLAAKTSYARNKLDLDLSPNKLWRNIKNIGLHIDRAERQSNAFGVDEFNSHFTTNSISTPVPLVFQKAIQ